MKEALLLALITGAACILSKRTTAQQTSTHETSNDPDSLCISGTTKHTGYKATKDCRGYVYCNDGYLMGGGVISCWPNQLFDQSALACTYWQNVDTANCPEFDGSMMMPDQKDENANEEKYFCGYSWGTARSDCIPCPGGSKLECPDPGHSCFAGVTGCPSPSLSSIVTANETPPPAPAVTQSFPSVSAPANIAVFNTQPQPQQQSPSTPTTVVLVNPIQGTVSFSDSVYNNPQGNSYFCGDSYSSVSTKCLQSKPCPDGYSTGNCNSMEGCFEVTVCAAEYEAVASASTATNESATTTNQPIPPSPTIVVNPPPVAANNFSNDYQLCVTHQDCETGKFCNDYGFCGQCSNKEGMGCSVDEVCRTASCHVTQSPGPGKCYNKDELKNFCQVAWKDTSFYCNLDLMVCESATTTNQPIPPSPTIVANPPPVVANNFSNDYQLCVTHQDCETGKFCNDYGFCGQCSNKEGMGCSVDEVCRTASCHVTQSPGPGKCYNKDELKNFCQVAWKDTSFYCNLDLMVCEKISGSVDVSQGNESQDAVVQTIPPLSPSSSSPPSSSSTPTPLPTVKQSPNPTKAPMVNEYFCGVTWLDHLSDCENSKPCPRGDECDAGYTCFSGSPCASNQTITTNTISTLSASTSDLPAVTESNNTQQQDPIGNIAVLNGDNSQHTNGQTVEANDEMVIKTCDICDGAGQLGWSENVVFEGNTISCGEFSWIFESQSVSDGSDKCLSYRSEYFEQCCFNPPNNGCDLCETGMDGGDWYDVNVVATTSYNGEGDVSCVEVSNNVIRKIESSSSQCAEAKRNHFDACCFQKCSICGDLQLDRDATVLHNGTEISCHELEGKVFFDEGIAKGSDTCRTSQGLHKATCCINSPENPCNLCRSVDGDLSLKSEANVVMSTGETESCLEVFQSLLSRTEQSSEQCISAQNDFQSKCCDGKYDYNNVPIPTPPINWAPSSAAGYPTEGFYYEKPDWNENWNNGNSRVKSTVTVFLLLSTSCVVLSV